MNFNLVLTKWKRPAAKEAPWSRPRCIVIRLYIGHSSKNILNFVRHDTEPIYPVVFLYRHFCRL